MSIVGIFRKEALIRRISGWQRQAWRPGSEVRSNDTVIDCFPTSHQFVSSCASSCLGTRDMSHLPPVGTCGVHKRTDMSALVVQTHTIWSESKVVGEEDSKIQKGKKAK